MAGLGRGLDALLSQNASRKKNIEEQENTAIPDAMPVRSSYSISSENIVMVAIDDLIASKYQPRQNFDQDTLEELANSIKENGLIEPLLVKAADDNKFEIICGERRFRACKIAGLTEIPCMVRDVLENNAYALALIENIQREDLNPLEQSNALLQMMDECDMTHEELAKTLGKSRSTITNLLRLNDLSQGVKDLLLAKKIDLGHAKVLLGLEDEETQLKAAEYVSDKELSVRQTEDLIKSIKSEKGNTPLPKPNPSETPESIVNLEQNLNDKLNGLKCKISAKTEDKGKITIVFKSKEELDQIKEIFGI
ncbi:MAG: ParB/RepB/Spo0J family partition protein [Succinivibrio sp.]|nr:ParB/RepB/Spo0J family partition protein [Succinivibrio sp.]